MTLSTPSPLSLLCECDKLLKISAPYLQNGCNDITYLKASLRGLEGRGLRCLPWFRVHNKKQLSVNCCSDEQRYRFYLMAFSVLFLHISVCTTCVPGTHEDQKRVSCHLKLQLQVVVSCHVFAGNQIQEQ